MTGSDSRAAAAEMLAARMAHHADCDSHSPGQPRDDCPFCADRTAYAAWLAAGGRDYRTQPEGRPVGLKELFAPVEEHRWCPWCGETKPVNHDC